MVQQFDIQKKGSQKLKLIYILLFVGAILFCISAVAGAKFIMFIPAFLLFFFAVRTYISRKRILGQKIEVDDDSVTYYLWTGECATLNFNEITYAGFYAKNPTKVRFSEGLYMYSDSADRYCLIGTDFERSDELYSLLKEKCNAANVKWQDLDYCGKNGLVKKLRELLNISDSETTEQDCDNLQETSVE
ncbi:MAG: hypothetical protein UHW86_11785 [Spirochaetota bacterium]|nr:hypothetical protein [Spirochaetota bacterium]